MRVIGFCQSCRRVKTVTVKIPMPGATQVGECSDCMDHCNGSGRRYVGQSEATHRCPACRHEVPIDARGVFIKHDRFGRQQ